MPQIAGARLSFDPIAVELDGLSNGEMAERCGIHRREIIRFRNDGVPICSADRIACRLGLHPLLLWGASWSEAEHAWELLKAESRERRRLKNNVQVRDRKRARREDERAWRFMERRRWQWVEQHERRTA